MIGAANKLQPGYNNAGLYQDITVCNEHRVCQIKIIDHNRRNIAGPHQGLVQSSSSFSYYSNHRLWGCEKINSSTLTPILKPIWLETIAILHAGTTLTTTEMIIETVIIMIVALKLLMVMMTVEEILVLQKSIEIIMISKLIVEKGMMKESIVATMIAEKLIIVKAKLIMIEMKAKLLMIGTKAKTMMLEAIITISEPITTENSSRFSSMFAKPIIPEPIMIIMERISLTQSVVFTSLMKADINAC